MAEISGGLKNLFENFRSAARELAFQGVSEPALSSCPIEDRYYYQQLAAVLIFGVDIRLQFKIHFMLKEATVLASQKFELAIDKVTPQLAVDMVKESCNRVAGRIMKGFNALNIDMGHSLPFGLNGYNEIYFNQFTEYNVYDCFRIADKDYSFLAAVWVDARNDEIENLLLNLDCQRAGDDQSGEFELL